jgi:AmiR/NasT family two-component response regulator
LVTRIVYEQAKGVLPAERGISVNEAFELLRRHARTHNARLRAVADAVVNLGLRP